MIFISILTLSTLLIAISAAIFSIYGLVLLFKGMATYALIMGISLELGKLVATSFLYRFWKKINFWLKSYLLVGIFTLMLITSMGIFGLLSVGYQTDTLPLKQLQQQVSLIEDEKIRLIDRKRQIDNQIANLPADYSRGRIKLMNGFKTEQEQVTSRITQLDKEVLDIKTKLINTEAHIGPITYIAKVFGLNTDDATKYLIYLIIFVFDPLAIALTIAINTVIKDRELNQPQPTLPLPINQDLSLPALDIEQLPPEVDVEPVVEPIIEPVVEPIIEPIIEPVTEPIIEPIIEPVVEPIIEPVVEPIIEPVSLNRYVTYKGVDPTAPIDQLLAQYNYYKSKEIHGDNLSPREQWTFQSIKDSLQKQGLNIYL